MSKPAVPQATCGACGLERPFAKIADYGPAGGLMCRDLPCLQDRKRQGFRRADEAETIAQDAPIDAAQAPVGEAQTIAPEPRQESAAANDHQIPEIGAVASDTASAAAPDGAADQTERSAEPRQEDGCCCGGNFAAACRVHSAYREIAPTWAKEPCPERGFDHKWRDVPAAKKADPPSRACDKCPAKEGAVKCPTCAAIGCGDCDGDPDAIPEGAALPLIATCPIHPGCIWGAGHKVPCRDVAGELLGAKVKRTRKAKADLQTTVVAVSPGLTANEIDAAFAAIPVVEVEEVRESRRSWEVRQGDALEILAVMEPKSIGGIVTDPPYCSTGNESSWMTDSGPKLPKETQFYEAWIREHLIAWRRVLRDDGAAWFTCDWGAATAIEAAAFKLRLPKPVIGVWYKEGLGMGHILRHVYENFVLVPMPLFKRRKTDETDLWIHKWTPSDRKAGHSAEKPPELMARAMSLICPPGRLILDPFTGSGSTGIAAVRNGYDFLGIERDEEFAALASERISHAERQGSFFAAAPAETTQEALFAEKAES